MTIKENGEINGFGEDKLKVIHGNLADKVTGKFDVIVSFAIPAKSHLHIYFSNPKYFNALL